MKLSIVLPVRNGLPYTRQCVAALRDCGLPSCEYIVVDNESTDGTAEWLANQQDITVVQGRADWGLAQSFNMGRKKATGDLLLFLHNDVVCHRVALLAMMEVMKMDRVAAAGPMTNRCHFYKQFVEPEPYASLQEMQAFADKFSHGGQNISVDAMLFLESFCLMVRAEMFDAAGGFDERFVCSGYEDADLSFRLLRAGYWLCKVSVYVHHGDGSFALNGLSQTEALEKNRRFFQDKWGVNLDYSAFVRYELLKYVDMHLPDLSVLEFGCALGGNLMQIKWRNRGASLFGVELNPHAAKIAASFGNVTAADAESMDFDALQGKFDYVIAGDVIEHLKNPWAFLRNAGKTLKPQGTFIASLPNVAHISNVYNLLLGFWNYEDAGILDRTHLRFFTKDSIFHMFADAGFRIETYDYNLIRVPDHVQRIAEALTAIPNFPVEKETLEAYQIFVKAKKQ